ncbi:MAG: hypothetical protein ACQEXJ_04635 [Myxococcota bacterium]
MNGLRVTAVALAALLTMAAASAHAASRQELRRDAEAAFETLKQRRPSARAVWRAERPAPAVVTGLREATEGDSPRLRAEAFVERARALLGVTPGRIAHRGTRSMKGRTVVRWAQRHEGLPVLDRELTITLDDAGRVLRVVNDTVPVGEVPAARVDEDAARRTAVEAAGLDPRTLGEEALSRVPAEQAVVANPTGARRVWVVSVVARPLSRHLRVLVDATSGDVVEVRNMVHR